MSRNSGDEPCEHLSGGALRGPVGAKASEQSTPTAFQRHLGADCARSRVIREVEGPDTAGLGVVEGLWCFLGGMEHRQRVLSRDPR